MRRRGNKARLVGHMMPPSSLHHLERRKRARKFERFQLSPTHRLTSPVKVRRSSLGRGALLFLVAEIISMIRLRWRYGIGEQVAAGQRTIRCALQSPHLDRQHQFALAFGQTRPKVLGESGSKRTTGRSGREGASVYFNVAQFPSLPDGIRTSGHHPPQL